MSNVVLLVLMASFLYALQNSFVEKVLAGYNLIYVQIAFGGCLLAISTVISFFVKLPGKAPFHPKEIVVVLGISAIIFLADYFFLSSYEQGGNAFLVASLFTTLPVMAGVIRFVMTRHTPSPVEVIGMLVVVAGVMIFTFGSKGQQQEKKLVQTQENSIVESPPILVKG